jgi:Serine carboxypeptidase
VLVRSIASAFAGALILGCSQPTAPPAINPPDEPVEKIPVAEAGLVDVPARDVTLNGKSVHLAARARLFYNLIPADKDADAKPIFIFSNGFSARIVRAFGTGPATVAEGGKVVDNPSSWTQLGNLVYLDPRQSGFSYDVIADRAPIAADCGSDVFNEYVDAADMLFATLGVLAAHPELTGPIYWVGESYAGVRIQWILAYLRGRWDLAPYDDPALRDLLSSTHRTSSLAKGQILLEPWLLGRAHADAIGAACTDPSVLTAVSSSVGNVCPTDDACACADSYNRSRYNYAYTVDRENTREYEAASAHVLPDRAAKLFGVPLTSIAGLDAADRSKGFKCDTADSETPPDDALVALFGALPMGQSYFIPYSPLQPGKEIQPSSADWDNQNYVGKAFVDNLASTPTFITDGHFDLVVPTSALIPGLVTLLGANQVVSESPSQIRVDGPSGAGTIDLGHYPNAGHMITMLAPDSLESDVAAWLTR